MATDKPRLSISMDEETFEKVIAYKQEKGIATQSKAIIKIMELGLGELEKEIAQKNFTSEVETIPGRLSANEQNHIKRYRLLDPYGKEAVDGVLDVESRRCEEERQRQAAILREQREQMEAADEITPRTTKKLVYINPAAAGTPLYAESDFEHMEFPEDTVPGNADFGIRISGRSMEPVVMDGAIAWVHKTREMKNGTVGIFMLNDSAVCKRFYKNDDSSIRLESDNPEFGPVQVTEFDTFVPVGEVVGTV